MRFIAEYPPGHFLKFSGKPIRRKSSSQIGFISLRLTAMFGNQGSCYIPRRAEDMVNTPPTQVSCLAALGDNLSPSTLGFLCVIL